MAHRDGCGAVAAQHCAHALDFFFYFFDRAVALAQQNRLGTQVVARVHKVFYRRRHGLVHHLQPGRNNACRNHRRHRVTGFAHIVKAGHDAACELRLGHKLDQHLQRDRQHAFAAHHHAHQVVARCVQRLRAKGDGLAFNRQAAHLQHVVQGQAVFQAMHAARVFGHIAANGAGDLARRVGGVVQAVGRGGLADGQVAHAALHARGAAVGVDLQNLVELGQRHGHAQGVGHGATRQTRARTARHHRHAQRMAAAQHRLHLRLGLGQGHDQRALAVGGQAVALVGCGVFGLVQQGVRGQVLRQRLNDAGLQGGAVQQFFGIGVYGCVHGVDCTGTGRVRA